jgi:hypothetical protein
MPLRFTSITMFASLLMLLQMSYLRPRTRNVLSEVFVRILVLSPRHALASLR